MWCYFESPHGVEQGAKNRFKKYYSYPEILIFENLGSRVITIGVQTSNRVISKAQKVHSFGQHTC